MLAQVIEKLNKNLDEKPLVSTVMPDLSQLSQLSHVRSETPETAVRRPRVVEQVESAEPEPTITAIAPPNEQKDILEWMLDGAKSDDNPDYYIKRLLAKDKTLSIAGFMEIVPKKMAVSRASMGRFLKAIKEHKYDSYIAEYCKSKNIPIENIYPYKVVVKESGGGLVVGVEE